MTNLCFTNEFDDLNWGDHSDGLPWSCLSNVGSIGAYSVVTINIWSGHELVEARLLLYVEFVYASLSKFHT